MVEAREGGTEGRMGWRGRAGALLALPFHRKFFNKGSLTNAWKSCYNDVLFCKSRGDLTHKKTNQESDISTLLQCNYLYHLPEMMSIIS